MLTDGCGKVNRLAAYNFALFVAPFDKPEIDDFRLREPFNFRAVERAQGFIGRSGYDGEEGPSSWGQQVFPGFMDGSGFSWAPSTLSLWSDIESLMAFTYNGVHADALKHAGHCHVPRQWPALVLWWTDHQPDWTEAVRRFEQLHDEGATPHAFHFKETFGPAGEPVVIDRSKVTELAALNAKTQGDLLDQVLSFSL